MTLLSLIMLITRLINRVGFILEFQTELESLLEYLTGAYHATHEGSSGLVFDNACERVKSILKGINDKKINLQRMRGVEVMVDTNPSRE